MAFEFFGFGTLRMASNNRLRLGQFCSAHWCIYVSGQDRPWTKYLKACLSLGLLDHFARGLGMKFFYHHILDYFGCFITTSSCLVSDFLWNLDLMVRKTVICKRNSVNLHFHLRNRFSRTRMSGIQWFCQIVLIDLSLISGMNFFLRVGCHLWGSYSRIDSSFGGRHLQRFGCSSPQPRHTRTEVVCCS